MAAYGRSRWRAVSPRLLVRLVKPDDPFMQSVRDEFATDGRRFYFTMTKFEADIWQVDLSPGK